MPGTTPNIGLTYQLLGDAADIEVAVKNPLLQLDAMRLGRRAVVYSAQQVRDVGEANQIRAGRQLAPADFTAMGLSAPAGLWNLSNVNDSSGNARNLTNKGTVPFTTGINGTATTAAQFAGSTAQALYIADTGAADPFRIKTGSWGCWFRTAKRGTSQALVSKWSATAGAAVFYLRVDATNVLRGSTYPDGTTEAPTNGAMDVADDRWHFGVVTNDGGRLRVYVDGALDGMGQGNYLTTGGAGPINIGALGADGAVAATQPHYGRVDEAFVTADILSPEQVLNLYCASITHGLTDISAAALAPKAVTLSVRRRRRGGPLATSDFPATPVRLHNFTAGVLTDQGSGGVTLVTNVGTGVQTPVAGADGASNGAYSLSGAHLGLSATDAGLPATTTARSYGTWFKTTTVSAGVKGIVGWGTANTADASLVLTAAGGANANSAADAIAGPFVADGLWHHAIVVEDNAAADGVKRKLYVDGRLVGGSTVLNTLTLAGANRFRVGAYVDGTLPFTGQIDGAFVYSGALTAEQVRALYSVGSQALTASPKADGDHVEASESTRLLVRLDSLEGCDTIDLEVYA